MLDGNYGLGDFQKPHGEVTGTGTDLENDVGGPDCRFLGDGLEHHRLLPDVLRLRFREGVKVVALLLTWPRLPYFAPGHRAAARCPSLFLSRPRANEVRVRVLKNFKLATKELILILLFLGRSVTKRPTLCWDPAQSLILLKGPF